MNARYFRAASLGPSKIGAEATAALYPVLAAISSLQSLPLRIRGSNDGAAALGPLFAALSWLDLFRLHSAIQYGTLFEGRIGRRDARRACVHGTGHQEQSGT